MTLLKRFTLAIHDGTVEHVFYPVFPPDRSGEGGDSLACSPDVRASQAMPAQGDF